MNPPAVHRATHSLWTMRRVRITTAQLCDRVGATRRQVDHWCSAGYLRPERIGGPGGGPGGAFRFDAAEVRVADVLTIAGAALGTVGVPGGGATRSHAYRLLAPCARAHPDAWAYAFTASHVLPLPHPDAIHAARSVLGRSVAVLIPHRSTLPT